ncbi:hypothetical protein GARC_4177 [Paraglaciecola arctica BSs20135]|uniref:Uncharacterized protein n=1 Tax=Paraglaciecola arctica BSs20135 TaxID=493475 RepID=K6XKC3_9ALTE|nr:hypothetical protein GARC_4177 [Paraglaciecola arctica BSs20135]
MLSRLSMGALGCDYDRSAKVKSIKLLQAFKHSPYTNQY